MIINIDYLLQNNHNILGFIGDSMFFDIDRDAGNNSSDKSQIPKSSKILKKVIHLLSNKRAVLVNHNITLKIKKMHHKNTEEIDDI